LPTKEEDFKQRLAGIMVDLTLVDDAETRLLIGGLANQLVTHADMPSWTQFNAQISRFDYSELLATLQRQGNELARQDGMANHVHAVEVLGVALVAKTQVADPEVISESARLDTIIDDTIAEFNRPQSPIIS
jgi:hypothetical protein